MDLQDFKANPGKSVFIQIPGPEEKAQAVPERKPAK